MDNTYKHIIPISFFKHCKFLRRTTTYICLVRHTLDCIFVKLSRLFLATIWEGFLYSHQKYFMLNNLRKVPHFSAVE